LVEVLVVLATMGFILGTAYAALFSGLDAYRYSAYESEVLTVLHRSLDRLFTDLACTSAASPRTHFVVVDDSVESEVHGEIPTDRLRFQAHMLKLQWEQKPQSDLTEVEYYVDLDPDTAPCWLVRRTDSPADSDAESGGEIHLVGPGVVGMNVELYNGSKWVSEWTSSELPRAVRIRLLMVPSNYPGGSPRLETMTSIFWIPSSGGQKASGDASSTDLGQGSGEAQ